MTSGGNSHRRAQLYADATLGKLDKDMLMPIFPFNLDNSFSLKTSPTNPISFLYLISPSSKRAKPQLSCPL
ncbi:DUF5724 domain-containing protein, partial [Clostridioides difficile]|uniref:DUF5724 domain-containing protein n=1 Tax=Clostridioides difficile TaxID=1496 RepID=UPI003F8D2D5F